MARKPADQTVSREEILKAAADVLSQKGYEAATMKDIASEVDLTAASLYYHFRNKEELVLAVLETGVHYAVSRVSPIAQSALPAKDKLRAMVVVHVVSLTEQMAVAAALVYEMGPLLGIRKQAQKERSAVMQERLETLIQSRDQFEQLFREVIVQGIQEGAFRPVDVPIFVKTMMGAHNWVGVWYRAGGRLDGHAIAEQMSDTFLRALLCSTEI
ncbi:MAG: TetR/AcrR family transcriptional regulator [Phototrophicaceae bacterium]